MAFINQAIVLALLFNAVLFVAARNNVNSTLASRRQHHGKLQTRQTCYAHCISCASDGCIACEPNYWLFTDSSNYYYCGKCYSSLPQCAIGESCPGTDHDNAACIECKEGSDLIGDVLCEPHVYGAAVLNSTLSSTFKITPTLTIFEQAVEWTVALWVKFDFAGEDIVFFQNGDAQNGFVLSTAVPDGFTFASGSQTTTVSFPSLASRLTDGAWINLVVAYASGVLKVSIADDAGYSDVSTVPFTVGLNMDAPVTIGGQAVGSFFIWEGALYSSSLSDADTVQIQIGNARYTSVAAVAIVHAADENNLRITLASGDSFNTEALNGYSAVDHPDIRYVWGHGTNFF